MTTEQFAYWLQGFSELNDGPPNEGQWQSIRDHLALVFDKKTPAVWVNDRTPIGAVSLPLRGAQTVC